MKPDAITALFADASAHFVPFAGNPTDNDLTAIREVLTPLLLGILYDADGRHNLVRLIAQRDKYKAKYSVFFARPKRPLLYDNTIDAAATPVVRALRPSTRPSSPTTPPSKRPSAPSSNSSVPPSTRRGTKI